jgi:hypothetical protein
MTAAGGVVTVPAGDSSIAILSESSQRLIARLPLPDVVAVTPAIHRGMLFAATGKHILAFDLARHLSQMSRAEISPAWTIECGTVIQPLLTDSERIYLSSRDGHRTMIDALWQKSGARAWFSPVIIDALQTSPPLLVKNLLIVIALSGDVSVIDSESGQELGKFSLGRRLSNHIQPYVAGTRAILVDADNNVCEIALSEKGFTAHLIYTHPARILTVAASEEFITIGHLSGLTLLNSRGNALWSSDLMESISVAPLIASNSIFALDDSGTGLLFDPIRSTPSTRVRLIGGEILAPPILTRASIAAANLAGEVAIAAWR